MSVSSEIMHCDDARKLLLARSQVDPHTDGHDDLAAHLSGCPACRQEEMLTARFAALMLSPTLPEERPSSEMMERVLLKLHRAFDAKHSHSKAHDFATFRNTVIRQLKLSLAAATEREASRPTIGRLEIGSGFYIVYFTKEKNELHLDFMDGETKRPTSKLDGSSIFLGKSGMPLKVKAGAADLALTDLIDASEMVIRLPSGEEIRVT